MASIDYAFIADFAKVDQASGTLTAVGASWTFLQAPVLPTAQRMSVTGRVRAHIDEGDVRLTVRFTAPDAVYTLEGEMSLNPGANARPYGDGQVGLLWALDLSIPIPVEGLYEVFVELPEHNERRRLAFDAILAPAPE